MPPIFPDIEVEPVVQVGDRTRLSAAKSFATQDKAAVTKVEIDPGTGTFIDVTPADPTDASLYYLDYLFASAGTKAIQSRLTCGSDGAATVSKNLTVITEAADHLFCSDSDLALAQPDVLKWVEPGRNTHKNTIRASQDEIVRYLDEKGYTDSNQNPLTKAAVVDINEVRLWSKFMTLRMIFEGISNASDDVFAKTAEDYEEKEVAHRNKALLRLDVDADGATSPGEGAFLGSGTLFRR